MNSSGCKFVLEEQEARDFPLDRIDLGRDRFRLGDRARFGFRSSLVRRTRLQGDIAPQTASRFDVDGEERAEQSPAVDDELFDLGKRRRESVAALEHLGSSLHPHPHVVVDLAEPFVELRNLGRVDLGDPEDIAVEQRMVKTLSRGRLKSRDRDILVNVGQGRVASVAERARPPVRGEKFCARHSRVGVSLV